MAGSSRRGALIGLGATVLVAGLIAAVVLWNLGGQRQSDAVAGLARAPVGCDTTLDFVETGQYIVFLETAGEVEGVRGDCDVEGSFNVSGRPDVSIELIDPDGREVELDRVIDDVEYINDGFEGESIFTIDIEERNDHRIRVESDDNDTFVVAIGRDPADGIAALRAGALAAAAAGVVLGGLLILLGARKKNARVATQNWAPGTPGAQVYNPGGPAPQGPPVYGQPGQAGPPQYQQPQYGQPQQPGYPPAGAPQYQQPQPQYQQPQYGQQPGQSPAGAPQYQQPQYEQATPPPPPPPFSPAAPQAPANPAGSAQPIDWAPSADSTARSQDTAAPQGDFVDRLRDERRTDPPPPPPQ